MRQRKKTPKNVEEGTESSSHSDYEECNEEEKQDSEGEFDPPTKDREIPSRPHGRGRETPKEKPRRETKLEPRSERTSTTQRRTSPVKKDMKFVN